MVQHRSDVSTEQNPNSSHLGKAERSYGSRGTRGRKTHTFLLEEVGVADALGGGLVGVEV